MHVILEGIVTLFLFIYYMFEGMICAILPLKRRKSVKNQTVLITGAGSGLGRSMAKKFAALGSKLVLWDVNSVGNDETAELVAQLGAQVFTYRVDLSDREDIYRTASKVKADVGDVDILINNAGIVTGKKFLECSDSLIEKTMQVNTNAHFWTVKSFLPSMLQRNRGHVVSIASSAGFFGVTGLADYCASKFAAVGFDESLRNEIHALGKDGVKTTVVCPAFINTGMFDGIKMRFSLIPILEQDYVIDKIMEAILTNQDILCLPKTVYFLLALKGLLPTKCGRVLNDFLGMNQTMDSFVGRNKQQ